jgi:AcrR family transcriptional regulator
MHLEAFEKLSPNKQDLILQCGISEFSKKPYRDANTDEITKAAGISKGILFHYFGTKKAFYLYCLDVSLRRLVAKTPDSESGDFFDLLFFVMDEKMRLCRDHFPETLMVNLAARDDAAEISAEKQALFATYHAETTRASQAVLTRAIATLPLKQPEDPKLLDALFLYIQAINQKYLLTYLNTPEAFFQNSKQIQSEIRQYLSYLLDGIVRREESK